MVYQPDVTITTGSFDEGNPTELDYLKPNGFRFLINALPGVAYFCQSANIPAASVGSATVATPLHDFGLPGEKVNFDELLLRFLIQEDMGNYRELYDWLIGIGSPENSEQYTNFAERHAFRTPGISAQKTQLVSDSLLMVLDSNNNPVIRIKFEDCYPTSLSGVDFDISTGNTDYFQGLATFRFRQYTIETV